MREPESTASAAGAISFAEAFRFWVKLGFISFGGPAGQIAIMHRELVERRGWVGEERFLHALNYCMLLPGPEAQQLAIYIGWLLHGVRGGLVAGTFFVIPSIFILLALSYIYAAYGNLPAVAGVLWGFKPVVVAIVVEAVLRIGRRALTRPAHYAIAAAAFLAIYFLHVPFPAIVLGAGLTGMAASTSGQAASRNPARSRWRGTLLIGVSLWAAPFAAVLAWRGWNSVHAQQYRFFTEAALVTFGGAYAVLAYVIQAAVGTYGWLSHAQAVDGLALAETTPGPLIMVLQFIGFMGGWNHPQGMTPAWSGTIGALVATYTTFLPCFLFIFLGAPYIELLRGNQRLGGALAGITAAVVGVILNLALVFGATVLTNWPAAVLTAAAFLALYRFRADVVWVVLAGGLVGWLRVVGPR